jgi:hypothetical protein
VVLTTLLKKELGKKKKKKKRTWAISNGLKQSYYYLMIHSLCQKGSK